MRGLVRGGALVAVLLLGIAIGYSVHGESGGGALAGPAGSIAAYFSPDGGCTEAVVREISGARSTIHVQAYTFTSAPIARALAEAEGRGVQVIAVLDQSNASDRSTAAQTLLSAQIPTYIDDRHKIAHNKVMVIDGATLITGSFNFTRSAEGENAENLLIVKDNPGLAQAYEKNFQVHLGHSYVFRGVSSPSRWRWKTDRN